MVITEAESCEVKLSLIAERAAAIRPGLLNGELLKYVSNQSEVSDLAIELQDGITQLELYRKALEDDIQIRGKLIGVLTEFIKTQEIQKASSSAKFQDSVKQLGQTEDIKGKLKTLYESLPATSDGPTSTRYSESRQPANTTLEQPYDPAQIYPPPLQQKRRADNSILPDNSALDDGLNKRIKQGSSSAGASSSISTATNQEMQNSASHIQRAQDYQQLTQPQQHFPPSQTFLQSKPQFPGQFSQPFSFANQTSFNAPSTTDSNPVPIQVQPPVGWNLPPFP